jgi:hypothetical protein
MALRSEHIPHHRERSALQKMSTAQGRLPLEKLYPTGLRTIEGMIAKGWVVRDLDSKAGASFCITPPGRAALKAKI